MPLKNIKVLLRALPLLLLSAWFSASADAAVSKTSKQVLRLNSPVAVSATDFSAAALSTTAIQWSWSTGPFTGSGIDGYHLYSSSTSTSTFITLTPSTSFYIDSGLGVNKSVTRWLTGYSGVDEGSDSQHIAKYTYALPPPTFDMSGVTASSAYIEWHYSSATAYAVEYSTDGGSYYARNRAIFVPWQTLQLLSNRNYRLRIGALNGDDELTPGEYSVERTTTTPPLDSGLAAVAVSSYTIEWRWDTAPFANTDITGFRLYKSSTAESGQPAAADAGGVIATLSPTTTYWIETYTSPDNITGNKQHARWIKAFGVLESVNRTVFNKYTYAVAPSTCGLLPTPTDFLNIEETSLNLAWPAGTLASKYPVEYSTAADFSVSMSSFLAGSALSTPVTGLTADTKYDFRVGAINGDDEQTPDNALNPGAYSTVYKVITRLPPTPTTCSPVTDTVIRLKWSTATYTNMNYVGGYVVSTPVYHSELGMFVNEPVAPEITDLTVKQYDLDYRLTNSTHTMGIAVLQFAPGYASYGSHVINDNTATFATPPNDVSFYSVRSSTVGLIWNEPIVPATQYRVERSTSVGENGTWVFISSVTGATFQDTGLLPGTTYSYRIGAINLLGIQTVGLAAATGGNRRDYSFVSSTITRHISPTLYGVATGTKSITWSWTNTVPGVLTYNLYTSTDGTLAAGLSAATTFWAEVNLSSANARYTRHVRSATSFGEGDYSEASVSTLANPPAAVVVTSSGVHTMALEWAPNGSARYRVDRSLDGSSWTGIKAWSDVLTSTSVTDTGLRFATTYYYAVFGYNDDGIVSVSSAVTAGTDTTLPLPASYTMVFATAAAAQSVTAPLPGIGQITVSIPAGAVPDGYIEISTSAGASPQEISKTSLDAATAKLVTATLLGGSIVELHLYDVFGTPLTSNLSSQARVTITYTDANDDGIVDGTVPQIQVSTLKLFNLDTSALVWNPLRYSTIDRAAKTVYSDIPHFSFYALGSIVSAAGALSDVFAYPNPYKPGSAGDFGQSVFGDGVVFESLPAGSKIRIFNLAGNLVRELTDDDGDGRCLWDARTKDGARAASGVYLYLVTSPAGGKKSGRIAIIK